MKGTMEKITFVTLLDGKPHARVTRYRKVYVRRSGQRVILDTLKRLYMAVNDQNEVVYNVQSADVPELL